MTIRFYTASFLLCTSLMLIGCRGVQPATDENPLPQESSSQNSAVREETSDSATALESIEVAKPDSAGSETAALALAPDVDVQTVASLLDRDDIFLLDVREQHEYDAGHIPGNTLIPVGSVGARLSEIPKDKEVIVYCHSGRRSARITQFLREQGYSNVHNMLGGIVAWQNAGFDVE